MPFRPFSTFPRGDALRRVLSARSALLSGIRRHFLERGFVEADPGALSAHPNLDPHVHPLALSARDASGKEETLFLHTSPELSLKKLLAAGAGNCFFLGKVYRDREGSPLHRVEFTLLEWYRLGEGAEAVMEDVEALVRTLAREIAGAEETSFGGVPLPLPPRWERAELSALFRERLGAEMLDEASLRSALEGRGRRPSAGERWEDLFHRALLDEIEPHLAALGAVFATGFPAATAAMARRRPVNPHLCDRFEGFLRGVEIVNGYEELTDPAEQEERLAAQSGALSREAGRPLPPDPAFLDALRSGLPPCSGAALGADRLLMLLLGAPSIEDVCIP
jgi:lysyl-tRNA synthetase class 2